MDKFLNDAESIQWARDVHNVPAWANSIIIHGNEDCPDKIECFSAQMPFHDSKPDLILYPTKD